MPDMFGGCALQIRVTDFNVRLVSFANWTNIDDQFVNATQSVREISVQSARMMDELTAMNVFCSRRHARTVWSCALCCEESVLLVGDEMFGV
jgi:hypothetical protein